MHPGHDDDAQFHSQEVVQVRTDTWYKGRVVLVGDAAYCTSPFSGMGVSGSLVGAYVLAGEINRNMGRSRASLYALRQNAAALRQRRRDLG
ncbi:FAD-dependent monooxygenase [Rhizobium laguerreae]|uniref:FAD-dependent monooxygenase n=1 Tax=Rhizobium laguerreae TaxID=1076926 RepID=UPI0032B13642